VRAHLLPGFREAREAALGAGALGSSISGAGPTMFALCDEPATARAVAAAMADAYAAIGVRCRTRVTEVDLEGARVVNP
jgi:homoserine kinase